MCSVQDLAPARHASGLSEVAKGLPRRYATLVRVKRQVEPARPAVQRGHFLCQHDLSPAETKVRNALMRDFGAQTVVVGATRPSGIVVAFGGRQAAGLAGVVKERVPDEPPSAVTPGRDLPGEVLAQRHPPRGERMRERPVFRRRAAPQPVPQLRGVVDGQQAVFVGVKVVWRRLDNPL